MKRREKHSAAPAVPEELARYVRSEWPGQDPLGQWSKARLAFIKAHGNETPIGSFLDVLREHARLVRQGAA